MQHAHKHHGADEVVTGSIPNASADKSDDARLITANRLHLR